MIELWAGAIVSTIAGCIYAAWGPKALLGTIAALAVVSGVTLGVVIYAETKHVPDPPKQSTHLDNFGLPKGYVLDPPKWSSGK